MDTWIIDGELFTLSDNEVILFNLANLDETVGGMRTSQKVTSWSIKDLLDEERK